MSSSPFNGEWSLGTLYKVTLNKEHPDATLHGFRGKDRSQERYFRNQEEIDAYLGELWLNGLADVTIEEDKGDKS